jgi:putative hydrolase
MIAVDRATDLHTHSLLTDGRDTWAAMTRAAAGAGLRHLGASDHVRRDSDWLPDYVAQVRALDGVEGIRVSCGVEVKILDSAGTLDLPASLPELDRVLIADHQFPGPEGPVDPRVMAARVQGSSTAADDTVDRLVDATCAAVARSPRPAVLAHLFSILPKCGLSEELVGAEHLRSLATACVSTDAAVEINEKWRCPTPRVLQSLHDAGVRLVAGSDAHRAADVGRWSYLDEVEASLAASPS